MSLRAPIALVNELSLPPNSALLGSAEVVTLLREFFTLVRALVRIRSDLALASVSPLSRFPLTPEGLGFADIAAIRGGRVKEHWRYIQSRRNIAPLTGASNLQLPGLEVEYRFNGDICHGLGVACSSGQLAVSFRTDLVWDAEELEITRKRVLEDASSGQLALETSPVRIRHATQEIHVDRHAGFVADLALPDPFSGDDLWADRANRYPHLEFLPSVSSQLHALGQGSEATKQVHDRLSELDDAARDWHSVTEAFPAWKSKVNPEGQQRQNLCMFTDLDGVRRCFHYHAYFTPGPGRIHFRVVRESQRLRIAYVGLKLGR